MTDPGTGQTFWTFDPNAVKFIDTAAQTAAVTVPVLVQLIVAMFPGIGSVITTIGALVIGVAGTWLKTRPPSTPKG